MQTENGKLINVIVKVNMRRIRDYFEEQVKENVVIQAESVWRPTKLLKSASLHASLVFLPSTFIGGYRRHPGPGKPLLGST